MNNRDIRELITLSKLEKLVVEYFLRHVSAGEIIAVLDLKEEVKKRARQGEKDLVSELEDAIIIKELYVILAMLVKNGYLEYKNGVYRLSQWIINYIKARKSVFYPGLIKSIKDIINL